MSMDSRTMTIIVARMKTSDFSNVGLQCSALRAFEKGVLQDTLNATKRLDHIRTVIVEVPQFAIMALIVEVEFQSMCGKRRDFNARASPEKESGIAMFRC